MARKSLRLLGIVPVMLGSCALDGPGEVAQPAVYIEGPIVPDSVRSNRRPAQAPSKNEPKVDEGDERAEDEVTEFQKEFVKDRIYEMQNDVQKMINKVERFKYR